jgi:hypothetical protein
MLDKGRRFEARTGMQSREIEEEVEEIILEDLISVSEVELEMCVGEEGEIRAVKILKF